MTFYKSLKIQYVALTAFLLAYQYKNNRLFSAIQKKKNKVGEQ